MKKLLSIILLLSFSGCQAQQKPPVHIQKVPAVSKHFHISTRNENNLIPFHNAEGNWGYLNAQTDSVVISPKYEWVNLFHNGIAKVYQPNSLSKNYEDRQLIGFIDTRGGTIFKPQFTGVYEVEIRGNQVQEESLSDLREVRKNDGTYGVISLQTGQWLFTMNQYARISFYDRTHLIVGNRIFYHDGKETVLPKGLKIDWVDFSPNFLIVKNKMGSSGLYTWAGKEILPTKYLDFYIDSTAKRIVASRLAGGMTLGNLKRLASNDNPNSLNIRVDLLDLQGHKIKTFKSHYQSDPVDSQTGSYQANGKTYYFSLQDGALVKKTVKNPQGLPTGYTLFGEDENVGLRSPDGKVIIPAKYRRITYNAAAHLLIATTKGLYHDAYNLKGENAFGKTYFQMMYLPKLKRFMVSDDSGAGQIDLNGKVMIPLEYDGFSSLSLAENPPYAVSKDGKSGIINGNGETIVPFIYDDIQDTRILDSTKVPYFIMTKNEKVGLMNSEGQWLLPMKYGYISKSKDAPDDHWFYMEAYPRNQNKYGLFNVKTKIAIPPIYDGAAAYKDFIIVYNRDKNTYWHQLLDLSGQPLTDTGYTEMEPTYGYLLCQEDGKYGILNKKGKTLIPFKYKYIWAQTSQLIIVEDENGAKYYMDISGRAYKMRNE